MRRKCSYWTTSLICCYATQLEPWFVIHSWLLGTVVDCGCDEELSPCQTVNDSPPSIAFADSFLSAAARDVRVVLKVHFQPQPTSWGQEMPRDWLAKGLENPDCCSTYFHHVDSVAQHVCALSAPWLLANRNTLQVLNCRRSGGVGRLHHMKGTCLPRFAKILIFCVKVLRV